MKEPMLRVVLVAICAILFRGATLSQEPIPERGRIGGSDPQAALPKPSPEVMRGIVKESHRHSMRVTAHTTELEDAFTAVEAGVDGLEHGVFITRLPDDNRLATLMRKQGTVYVPTLRPGELFAVRLFDLHRSGAHPPTPAIRRSGRDAVQGSAEAGIPTD